MSTAKNTKPSPKTAKTPASSIPYDPSLHAMIYPKIQQIMDCVDKMHQLSQAGKTDSKEFDEQVKLLTQYKTAADSVAKYANVDLRAAGM